MSVWLKPGHFPYPSSRQGILEAFAGLAVFKKRACVSFVINTAAHARRTRYSPGPTAQLRVNNIPYLGWTRTPSAKTSTELGTTHSINLSQLTHSCGLVRLPMGRAPPSSHFMVRTVVSPWHMTASMSM